VAFDMHEIIDEIFMRATDLMQESCLRMDEDHVGKPQDLYLWCSVSGAKNWGLGGCPMPVQDLLSLRHPRRGIILFFSFIIIIIIILVY
jgi:hypothetical protein